MNLTDLFEHHRRLALEAAEIANRKGIKEAGKYHRQFSKLACDEEAFEAFATSEACLICFLGELLQFCNLQGFDAIQGYVDKNWRPNSEAKTIN